MAEVVKTLAAPLPEDTRLHQRRRQLQRLAAPLLPLPWAAPRRPHPARADFGSDGLRPAGRRGRGPARAAAHRGQHRRRRRLPDDRPGACHRHRLRRGRAGCSASSSTTAPTARSACTRSASTRAGSAAAICSTPISWRWPGPMAGAPASASTHRALRAGASARRSRAGRPTLLHIRLDTEVITSRTTLRAIRASAERHAAGKAWQTATTTVAVDRIDCLVVGAGVVGLAFARALARGGREVVVIDGRRHRHRHQLAQQRGHPCRHLLRAGLAEGAALRARPRAALSVLRGARRRAPALRQADRRHPRRGRGRSSTLIAGAGAGQRRHRPGADDARRSSGDGAGAANASRRCCRPRPASSTATAS